MKKETKEIKGMVDDLEVKLEEIFVGKLWALPKNVKEIIVKISPYLAIISLIALIPMVLALTGLSFLTPVAFLGGMRAGFGYIVSVAFALIVGVLTISTIPGLFKRERKAWKILFWVSLVNAVGELLRMDLGNLIIGTAISWYILFQVKEYYKN
jgi:hypothetical protein